MFEDERNTKEKLDDLHNEWVGDTEHLLDIEKIVDVILELSKEINELKGHTHSIR